MKVKIWQLVVTGLAVLLAVEVLFDPLSQVDNAIAANALRRDLPAETARWASQHLSDYSNDVHGFGPVLCPYNATLIIRHDALAQVLTRKDPLDPASPLIALSPDQWDNVICSYSRLTISNLLQLAAAQLADLDWRHSAIKLVFDPQQGYVRRYDYYDGCGYGLLDTAMSDCHSFCEFSNFRPLTPGAP